MIPAYNEATRLPQAIPQIVDYCRKREYQFELIVVDDGSQDDTATVAGRLGKRYPGVKVIRLHPNRGKGGAVKAGMIKATRDLVLFTDADQSTPIKELDKLLPWLKSGKVEIAIGSRAVAGSKVIHGQTGWRQAAARGFDLLDKLFLVWGVKDTQCGFKLFTRKSARELFPKVTSKTAIFDMELLLLAARAGYRIAEVPVTWTHNPDTRIPYNFKKSLFIFRELLRIKHRWKVIWPVHIKTYRGLFRTDRSHGLSGSGGFFDK